MKHTNPKIKDIFKELFIFRILKKKKGMKIYERKKIGVNMNLKESATRASNHN
jgi:hypothetical protein